MCSQCSGLEKKEEWFDNTREGHPIAWCDYAVASVCVAGPLSFWKLFEAD